jgi:cytidyltransferase-like protein
LYTSWPRDVVAEAKSIVNKVQQHRKRPASLFIGRWQPFHNGHAYIIQKAIQENKRVIIGVRDMCQDENNPYSFNTIERCLWRTYGNQIEVISIPDVESINIGRDVGYAVNEIQVPEDIRGISATAIRDQISADNNEWQQYVPKGVADVLNVIKYRS